MWKFYKHNGHYVEGELVSQHKTEDAAVKRAKKEIDFKFSEREKRKDEILIWLDDMNHVPIGVIVYKLKRGRNGIDRVRRKNSASSQR